VTTRKFYGWWIVVASCALVFFGLGLGLQETGLYMTPVTKDLGISISDFSWTFSVGGIAMALGMWIFARALDRGNFRVVQTAAAVGVVAAELLFSVASHLWQFIALQFLLAFSLAGLVTMPVSIMITNWFDHRRGFFMGIAFTGAGFGGMIFIPVITELLYTVGWRTTYRISGLIIGVTLLPVVLFLCRKTPELMAQQPYRGKGNASPNAMKGAEARTDAGVSFEDARRTPAYWWVGLVMLVWGLVVAGVMNYVPTFLIGVGLAPLVMAAVLSIMRVWMLGGTLAGGYLFDRVGVPAVVNGCSVLMALACVALLFTGQPGFAWVFAALFGVGQLGYNPAPPLLATYFFGKKDFVRISGFFAAMFPIGNFFGPLITGYLHDWTGSYQSAWIVYVAVLAAGVLALMRAVRSNKKRTRPPATTAQRTRTTSPAQGV
jgi:MFS transporter, OFA family, oxalate/formate antiporter